MSTTLHKDLTGADLHVNKLHATTHVEIGTDPLVLAESQVADLVPDLAGKVNEGDARLSDARAPTPHAHSEEQITDLVADLADKVDESDARLSDARTPTAHTHPESEVTALVTDLAGKVGTGDSRLSDARTPVAHTQAEATVIDLVDDLAGKAPTSHTHTKSQITDMPTTLPASDVSAWAKAGAKPSYTNTEVGAAAAVHAHVKADVSDFPALGTASPLDVPATGNASTTQVVKGSDTRLSDARTPSAHSHAEADVTNLTTDLAAKIPKSLYTEKGDIIAAQSSISLLRLAIGSNGQVLTADPAYAAGVKWATPAVGGSGDVVGPAAAVDGHLAVFDTTTGKLIKDGGAVPTTLPASDVSAWAKAGTQPAPIAHTQTLSTISDVTATATEVNYCSGLTANIQTQLGDVASALAAIVG